MAKLDEMKKIGEELFALNGSPLYKYRNDNNYLPVVGEGDLGAKILFVGEAPGKKEAETGKPFCGAAGKFLTELIQGIGLKREYVYITNIVKDRPPENRDPTAKEIELYGRFLDRQINIIKPKVIVTLGRYSMNYVMKTFGLESELQPIGKLHGKVFDVESNLKANKGIVRNKIGLTSDLKLKIVTLYHPAAALYNGSMRKVLKKDFEVLKEFID